MWDAFGGHLVPCEEPSSALVRELEEELGITVLQPRFLGIYEDIDPTSKELFRHYLFFVTRWRGEPRIANDEHSEIRWFTPDEAEDRKSTRLNSSHANISYAVFCLKKKKKH